MSRRAMFWTLLPLTVLVVALLLTGLALAIFSWDMRTVLVGDVVTAVACAALIGVLHAWIDDYPTRT